MKSTFGQSDPIDGVAINVHEPRLAFDRFSLARQFVERNAALFDGGDHRRHLIKIAAEFLKRGANVAFIEWRAPARSSMTSPSRSCVLGCYPEHQRPRIFLVLAHEQILNFGSASEGEKEQAGRDRIERAAMADFLDLQTPPHERDDIVRCHALRPCRRAERRQELQLRLTSHNASFSTIFFFHFGKRPAHACAGGEGVAAATKLLANRADIDRFVFRAHADAHFAIGQFLEKDGHDHALNGAQMIDQAFVVFRHHAEIGGGLRLRLKLATLPSRIESHRAEQFAQQLDAAARIIFVKLAG